MANQKSKLVLYHHPFTRARTGVWMLEEIGEPYDVEYVHLQAGQQRTDEFRGINPMGKVPALADEETVVTETAAIGLYLADRYALGTLAPRPDAPERGPYLRWSIFAPSVIEPGLSARAGGWTFEPTRAGWGDHETMLQTMEHAIGDGPWLLGDTFTMADVIFGATVRFMLSFDMLEARSTFTAYSERLAARPAFQAAEAKNHSIAESHGLTDGS